MYETNFNYRIKYFTEPTTLTIDQNIDGSLVPIDYIIEFPADKTYVKRLDFVCASTNVVSTLDYGLISGGLTNGIQLIKVDDSFETELFNVKRFIEYGHFVDGQIGQVSFAENPSENILIASVNFDPMLPIKQGAVLIVRIRDNLSMLRYHRSSALLMEP